MRRKATLTARVSSKVDSLQAFRKKVAPLISHIGRPARGPDDPTTLGLVTRTYSDGTVHTISIETLPETCVPSLRSLTPFIKSIARPAKSP
jgi:hypothetical protein